MLSAFLAVAEERSFTRAARRLGVSPSALSHAIRGLEERIGVRLLARTTRSVAPTEAGEQFIARLGPALADVRGALDQVAGLRDKPAGTVRLVASRLAARMVLAPKLAEFARNYPDVGTRPHRNRGEPPRSRRGRFRRRHPPGRVHRAGHGRGARFERSAGSDRRCAKLLRITSTAKISPRLDGTSMHQLSTPTTRILRRLPLGVRQGTEVAFRGGEGPNHRR